MEECWYSPSTGGELLLNSVHSCKHMGSTARVACDPKPEVCRRVGEASGALTGHLCEVVVPEGRSQDCEVPHRLSPMFLQAHVQHGLMAPVALEVAAPGGRLPCEVVDVDPDVAERWQGEAGHG